MANILDSLLNNQAQYNAISTDIYNKTAALTAEREGAIDSKVQLEQQLAAQKLEDENRATTAGKAIAAALGADPSAANFRLGNLAKQQAEANDTAMAAASEYQKLTATSFFENPLMFIINHVKADSVAETANAASFQADAAMQEIQQVNAQVQSGMETQRAISKTISDSRTAKELELNAATAKEAAAELKIKGLKANADALQAMAQGNTVLISDIHHQQDTIMAQQSLAMRQAEMGERSAERQYQHAKDARDENFRERNFTANEQQRAIVNALNEDKFDLTAEKWDAKVTADANKLIAGFEGKASASEAAAKNAKTAEERLALQKQAQDFRESAVLEKARAKEAAKTETLAPYRAAIDRLGLNIKLPDNPDAAIATLKAMKEGDKESFAAINRIAVSSTPDHMILGLSPVKALRTINAIGATTLPPGMQEVLGTVIAPVQSALIKESKDAKGVIQPPQITEKTKPEEAERLTNAAAVNRFNAMLSDAETYPVTKAPPLPVWQSFNPKLVKSQFFQQYIAPEIAAGKSDSSVAFIAERTIQAIKDGKLDTAGATHALVSMYSNAALYNSIEKNTVGLGLPAQRNYIYNYVRPNGGAEPLDVTDPAQASRLITLMMMDQNPGMLGKQGTIVQSLMNIAPVKAILGDK